MNQNQQLNLNLNYYRHHLLAEAVDSKVSFNEIDTPGWTSMVTTLKQSTVLRERPINQILISESEVKFRDKNINSHVQQSRGKQNKIRHSDIHLNVPNKYTKPIQVSINVTKQSAERKQQKPMKLSQRIQLRLKNHLFQTQPSASFQFNSSERSSLKPKKAQNTKPKFSSVLTKNSNKRFKEITVHQHLYQSSKRIMNKRAIQNVLDQKYQNKYITTFHPVINQKSCKIFEEKLKGKQSVQETATQSNSSKIQENQKSQEQHFSKIQIQQKRQELEVKHLFEFLSEGQQKITQKSINKVIQQLPLACVRYLQGLVCQILSGKSLTLTEFTKALNNKKLVCNKKSLLNSFQRSNNKNSIVLK